MSTSTPSDGLWWPVQQDHLLNATGKTLIPKFNAKALGVWCHAIVKPIVNTISRLLGGPKDSKKAIEDLFGNDDARDYILDRLHANRPSSEPDDPPSPETRRCLGALQYHCHKLLAFADPKSKTVNTQRETFKMLVVVITRYPGIRHLFRTHEDLKSASVTDPHLGSLWKRDQWCDEDWQFHRDFAVFCISDSDVTKLVEAEPPSKLSRLPTLEGNDNLVPIVTLIVNGQFSEGSEFRFFRLSAVLYLAGILELPGFWGHLIPPSDSEPVIESKRRSFFEVICKLCRTVLVLIEDTGVVTVSSLMGFARNAVDRLACSILIGVHLVHRQLCQCPVDVSKVVDAVLNDVRFVRARKPALAVQKILPSLTSTTDDSLLPDDNQSEHASGVRLVLVLRPAHRLMAPPSEAEEDAHRDTPKKETQLPHSIEWRRNSSDTETQRNTFPETSSRHSPPINDALPLLSTNMA
ncbi:hypothetical protein DFH06DRAFT_1318133 [Mycena polygramma]|nr:hypothetical protein DFH06DRAFT_1318133 [Mycena polygramma]